MIDSILVVADGTQKIPLSTSGFSMLVAAIAIYLLGLLGVSIYASFMVKDEQDFLVAGRRLPLHLSWGALMATWFGSSAIIGASNNAWKHGLSGVILDPFACSATLLLTGLVFAGPLWKLQLFTMADFYNKKYGHKAEFFACAIQLPTFFCWIASQYVALSAVITAYFNVNNATAILISAVLVSTYTLIGGMWSVTLTDAIQIVIALVGLVVLGYAVFSSLGDGSVVRGVSSVISKQTPERLSFVSDWSSYTVLAAIGTFLTGLLGNVPGQDLQQRIFAAKDTRVASMACILSSIVYFAFGLIPVLLGLAAYAMNMPRPELDTDGHMLLPMLASQFLHEFMVVVFVLAILSIIVSVATSATISQATILASNVLGKFSLFQGHHLMLDRICVLIVTIGSVATAFSGKSIMSLLDIQLSVAMVALFVPLVMGIFGKPRGQLSGILPMVLGGSVWLLRFLFEEFYIEPQGDLAHYPTLVFNTMIQSGYGSTWSFLGKYYAEIPADIQGLVMSFAGYFIGQKILSNVVGRK